MSNKHTFEGLQFRIMETLEKQPRQAPLTAMEIANILHASEYRDEMKDNVVFKVTRAIHSMKDKGKIIATDARDREGRICYQLPSRLKFPPRDDKPPVNPVLTPELAAQVKTVEPKKETDMKGKSTHQIYAPGILDKIVRLLDNSPHPLISPEITEQLDHLYPENIRNDVPKMRMIIAGHLHGLSRGDRPRVFARRVGGYGRGVKFEYYTRKTGREPHPLSIKNTDKNVRARVPQELVAQASPAPKPSEAWKEPAPVAAAQPAPSGGGLFRPGVKRVEIVQLNLDVPRDKKDAWKAAAERFGVPLVQLVTEAMDYALEHTENA